MKEMQDFDLFFFAATSLSVFKVGTNSNHMTVMRHNFSLLRNEFYLCSSLKQIPTVGSISPQNNIPMT